MTNWVTSKFASTGLKRQYLVCLPTGWYLSLETGFCFVPSNIYHIPCPIFKDTLNFDLGKCYTGPPRGPPKTREAGESLHFACQATIQGLGGGMATGKGLIRGELHISRSLWDCQGNFVLSSGFSLVSDWGVHNCVSVYVYATRYVSPCSSLCMCVLSLGVYFRTVLPMFLWNV